MLGEKKETRVSTMWMETDKILFWVYKQGAEVSEEDARQEVETAYQLVAEARGGIRKKCGVVIDLTKLSFASREAREVFANLKPEDLPDAVAVLVKSPLSKIMGDLFLIVNRPKHRVRLFVSEEKALEWVKTVL